MYYEANIAASAFYKSRAVKAMLGSFQGLFGTKAGLGLIAWCKKHNVVLIWTHNPLFVHRLCTPLFVHRSLYTAFVADL